MSFIEMQGITKIYPGTIACNKVSVSFDRGEVHTLLGENGAGKTTLMKVLYGLAKPDEGKIFVNGQEKRIDSPKDAIEAGVGMVHQHFMLIPTITVVENVILSLNENGLFIDKKKVAERLLELADRYGLKVDPYAKVSTLTVGQQQRVEILKALYRNCELLILDEPTAVLTPQETEELFVAVRNLLAEDKGVIFISHKMNEVMEISNKITVLHLGEVVGSVKPEDTDARGLAKMMVGREIKFEIEKSDKPAGDVVLDIKDLCAKDARGVQTVNNLSLSVRAGEIYGVAGVDGNGQSELIKSITGLCKCTGKVTIGDKDVTNAHPRTVLDCGVAHIPEDRQARGMIMKASIRDNLILDTFYNEEYQNGPFLKWAKLDEHARYIVENYNVKTPDIFHTGDSLSGGNQQKMVVGRELDKNPKLLLAVHPVRGVDVGATEFIHEQIVAARDAGCAVLLISTELDEIFALSDRIGVIYEGEILGEMDRKDANIENIGMLMAGNRI